jgi:hypothetical protein
MTASAASNGEWKLDQDIYKAALESLKAEGIDPGRKTTVIGTEDGKN